MTNALRPVKTGLVLAAGAFLLLSAGCALTRLDDSARLVKASQPFEAAPPSPARHVLIVGDSTAVGTGATAPRASVAGLIAQDHPDWAIVNRAVDGAKFEDIADKQLAGDQHFDIVLVMAGGNDVIRLTGSDKLRESILRTAERAKARADTVILMPAGNVGNAPFFFPPWSWWMTQRSQALHAMVEDAARKTGARYVNLYQDKADDPFAKEPDRYNASDHLHPSDAGYRLWYGQLEKQAGAALQG